MPLTVDTLLAVFPTLVDSDRYGTGTKTTSLRFAKTSANNPPFNLVAGRAGSQ
jgi:hypothetical protein